MCLSQNTHFERNPREQTRVANYSSHSNPSDCHTKTVASHSKRDLRTTKWDRFMVWLLLLGLFVRRQWKCSWLNNRRFIARPSRRCALCLSHRRVLPIAISAVSYIYLAGPVICEMCARMHIYIYTYSVTKVHLRHVSHFFQSLWCAQRTAISGVASVMDALRL